MMYTVYILYSSQYKKTYTGYTSDMERRLFEHNISAVSGYCIRYRPWIILHTELFENKQDAMNRERFYKSGIGREIIKGMLLMRYPPEAEKD